MKQIIILSLAIFLSLQQCSLYGGDTGKCQPYHKRVVYLNQEDNVCQGDRQLKRRDVLNVEIGLPNQEIQELLVTLTSCGNWALTNWDEISVLPQVILTWNWRANGEHDEIAFIQEKEQVIHENIVLGVIVKTWIDSTVPTKIQGVNHLCSVEGDDTIYHFGYHNGIEPPTIKVSCTRLANLMTE